MTRSQEVNEIFVQEVVLEGVPESIKELDYGESHTLTCGRYHGFAVATDDMEAREVARKFDIPCTGSLGILIRGNEREELSLEEAESWHTTWIENNNYYSPIDSVSELL